MKPEDRPVLGPFADSLNPKKEVVHVTELIVSGDGKLLNRRDRAARVPIYIRQATTRYDPLNNSRASHVQLKIASFRELEPPRQHTFLSQAKSLLGKFFSKLIGREGGNGGTPLPEENLEAVDNALEGIKMPQVEVYEKRA